MLGDHRHQGAANHCGIGVGRHFGDVFGPRNTEAERLVIQRIGQDVFRSALMDYWNGRCPLTGITDPALL